MTIPFPIPFARCRLDLSLNLGRAKPDRPRHVVEFTAADGATDAELVRAYVRNAASKERLRWDVQAVLHGHRYR
jgi:hypothetical protein